eukprot:scaffold77644_cov67-Phaeocystis_antarctica.AAC.1
MSSTLNSLLTPTPIPPPPPTATTTSTTTYLEAQVSRTTSSTLHSSARLGPPTQAHRHGHYKRTVSTSARVFPSVHYLPTYSPGSQLHCNVGVSIETISPCAPGWG